MIWSYSYDPWSENKGAPFGEWIVLGLVTSQTTFGWSTILGIQLIQVTRAHSAWPSHCCKAQKVLAMASVTAEEETASSA